LSKTIIKSRISTSYNNSNINNNSDNWHEEEVQKLDRKIRKMLTVHEQHHPRADIDCLYVPKKEGGRGRGEK
jgi:hypothetical protein